MRIELPEHMPKDEALISVASEGPIGGRYTVMMKAVDRQGAPIFGYGTKFATALARARQEWAADTDG